MNQGTRVELTVAIDSEHSGDAEYQWYRNGMPLEGETEPVCIFENIMEGQEGNYSCVVTAGGTSKESNIAAVEIIYYIVTYNAGDGRFYNEKTHEYDQAELEDCSFESEYSIRNDWQPVWDAHTFLGWSYDGETVIEEDSITLEDHLTLIAVWYDESGYRVTYDANGGTFPNGETEMTSVAFTQEYLQENGYYVGYLGNDNWIVTPVRGGDTFCGWSENPNWTEEDYVYDDGSLNSDHAPDGMAVNGNITLYACWVAEEPTGNDGDTETDIICEECGGVGGMHNPDCSQYEQSSSTEPMGGAVRKQTVTIQSENTSFMIANDDAVDVLTITSEVKGIDEVIYYSWEYSLDGEEWFAIGTMNEDPSIFEYRVAELLNLGTDITFRLTVNGIQSENTIHVTIQKIVMEVENPATDGDITNNYGNGDNITVDGNITENGTGDAITTDGNESEIGNNGTGEDVFTDNGTGETVITDNGTGETTGDEDAGFSEEIDDNGTDEGVPVTDDAGLFSGEEQDIEVIFTA